MKVYVWNEAGRAIFGTRPWAVKEYAGTLLNLQNRVLDLDPEDNHPTKGAKVTFRIEGIPPEPELPLWKD